MSLQEADIKLHELICEHRAEMEADEEMNSDDPPAAGLLNYACNEVARGAMQQFNDSFIS